MTVPYATLDDVILLGLGAQAFACRARPVVAADVNTSTGVIRLEAHGYAAADVVTVAVTSGGGLATGLVTTAVYGIDVVSFDLLRLTASGVPITSYATAGSGWSIRLDPRRRIERHLLDWWSIINDKLTAHAPSLKLDPAGYSIVTGLNARGAAYSAATTLQLENTASREAIDRLEAMIAKDWENLATYLAGRPINPRPVDQTAVAENGPLAAAGVPVNWQQGWI